MNLIPIKALSFGGEGTNELPVSYGKSRVSGSKSLSYIMHSRAGRMPGQKELFTVNSLTKPSLETPIGSNQILNSFKLGKVNYSFQPIGQQFTKTFLDQITYDKYEPHDDEVLEIAILACYKQVYGNFHPMESERPKDMERLVRNGDIPIKEFVRKLALSDFYRIHYYEKVNPIRSIELNFKHLLGRPPHSLSEAIHHTELIFNEGFNNHINSIIDSNEYNQAFGLHKVPYQRCWDSPCGMSTSSFTNTAALTRSYATSDNAIHGQYSDSDTKNGRSALVNFLAQGFITDIKIPSHATNTNSSKANNNNSNKEASLEKQEKINGN